MSNLTPRRYPHPLVLLGNALLGGIFVLIILNLPSLELAHRGDERTQQIGKIAGITIFIGGGVLGLLIATGQKESPLRILWKIVEWGVIFYGIIFILLQSAIDVDALWKLFVSHFFNSYRLILLGAFIAMAVNVLRHSLRVRKIRKEATASAEIEDNTEKEESQSDVP